VFFSTVDVDQPWRGHQCTLRQWSHASKRCCWPQTFARGHRPPSWSRRWSGYPWQRWKIR